MKRTFVTWRCRNPERSPAYGWGTSTATPLSVSSRWRRNCAPGRSAILEPEEVRKMPIYEYECRTCQLRFERLARPTATCPDTKALCPKCHGEDVQQLVSL